jgi:membrane-associated phospholipid phosphatase
MFATLTRRISLSALAVAGALGVVVFRLLGTHTRFGRNFDFSAIRDGLALGGSALNSSNALLVAVTTVSVVLVGAVLLGSLVLRRRFDVALACAVILGAPLLTTEFLKRELPARHGFPHYLTHAFPSGHSTVALSIGLAVILATPAHRRAVAAVAAAVYAAGIGSALVFNAWHLPSDVGGGFCVALAWSAVAARLAPRPVERGLPVPLLAASAVLVALAGAAAVELRPGLSFNITVHGRLFEAAVGIALTAAVCCAAFVYAIAPRSASATRS